MKTLKFIAALLVSVAQLLALPNSVSLQNAATVARSAASGGGAPALAAQLGSYNLYGYYSSNTITTAATASVGQRIVVRIILGAPGSQTVSSITDTAGNTYSLHLAGSSLYGFARGECWSAPVTATLSSGNTITVTYNTAHESACFATAVTLNNTSGSVVTGLVSNDDSPGTTESNSISTGGAAVCLSVCDIAADSIGYTTATNYTDELGSKTGTGYTVRAQYRTVSAATTTNSGGVWAISYRWLNLQVAFL